MAADAPRELPRPRSLILYVYGGFVRRLGGWLAVANLIQLMSDLGVEGEAVRSAVTRMKRRGLLERSLRGGVAGYALTPEAWRILDEGDRRILAARRPAELAEGWVLVVFSIPETERDRRHLIRSRLIWLGFGTVAPGVWIAPRRLKGEAQTALAELRLGPYVELFDVADQGPSEARRLVGRCWDLDRLGQMYAAFSQRWQPVLDRWTRPPPPDRRRAFVDHVLAIAQWRKLPFLDPGLPAEVLPRPWEGERASRIYFTLLSRLDPSAFAYVRSIALGD
jgi:phenylacetic acid degradation operon negative regulatory protein